ncbi:LppA family lipoprotein [Actinokineospora sp.]|uniref:LppA family lipoprotein n=1 Tax=Actinokineospora sp. TaxID=1872133 RepID=UPI004037934C
MRAAIRERLVTVGIGPWVQLDKISRSGCRAYPGVSQDDKEARGLAGWYHDASISDETWPEAVRVVVEIAGGYGFDDLTTVVDRPGDHEISLTDQYGGELIFGTKLATILSARTGCHLRPESRSSGAAPTTS